MAQETLRVCLIFDQIQTFAETDGAVKHRKWTSHVTTQRICRTGRCETCISHAEGLARCPESRSWHWASPGSRAADAPSTTHSLNIHMPDTNSFEDHTSALTSDSCFPLRESRAIIIVGYLTSPTCVSRKAVHASFKCILSCILLVDTKAIFT